MASPNRVYDQDDEKPITRPNLGSIRRADDGDGPSESGSSDNPNSSLQAISGGGQTTQRGSGHLGSAASSGVGTAKKSLSSEDINSLEDGVSDKPSDISDSSNSETDSAIKEQNWITNLKPQKNRSTGGRKALIAGGGFVGFLVVILGVFLLFFGDLKIQHVAQNITTWNMARTARIWRQSMVQETEQVAEVGVMDQGRFGALKTRFGDSKVASAIEKINEYRPQKVAENFGSGIKPVFTEGEDRILGLGKKQIFQGYETADGQFISNFESTIRHPRADKIRFGAEMQAAMDDSSFGANSLVKSQAMKKVLSDRGIKLYWWEKKGKTYNDSYSQAQAERRAQVDSRERIKTESSPDCVVNNICDASTTVTDAVDQEVHDVAVSLEDKTDERGAAAINDATTTVGTDALDAAVKASVGERILSFASTTYGVALPLCLIYEGSIHEGSGKNIDAASNANMKSYAAVQSASDQQESGDTTAWAVAGFNGKLGSVSGSVPLKRQSANPINTAAEINPLAQPQTSSTGAYTLFDAYLGSLMSGSALAAANAVTQTGCKVFTNPLVGLGEATAEIVAAILSAGSTEAATVEAGNSLKLGLKALIDQSAKDGFIFAFKELGIKAGTKAVSKAGGMFILKTGIFVGATLGMTELAKMAVLKHSNEHNSGLEVNETFVNQADMGANLYYNENNRVGMYGRPLTSEEYVQTKEEDIAYINQMESQKSFSERYFARSNASSLITRMGYFAQASMPEPRLVGANFIKTIGSIFNSPFSLVSNSLNNSKVLAASTATGAGDYNIVQWGWAPEEEALIENNDDYMPMMNDLILDNSGNKDKIEKEFKECYEDTMGTILAGGKVKRNNDGSIKQDKGKCSPDNLGLKNDSYGENMVFRWRLSKRNSLTHEHLMELQNPTTESAAQNSATPTTPPSTDAPGDTYATPCAEGTTDISQGTPTVAYNDGQPHNIRLCEVPTIKSVDGTLQAKVSSVASKNFLDLASAASKAGHTLVFNGPYSTFRTMEQQTYLCNKDPVSCAAAFTAKPGYSNHQTGAAIDFNFDGFGTGSSSLNDRCKKAKAANVRCELNESPTWVWMNQYAIKNGIRQLWFEYWHWGTQEVDGPPR